MSQPFLDFVQREPPSHRGRERRAIHVEHPKYNVVHRDSKTLRPASAPRLRAAKGRDRVADMLRRHPDRSHDKIATRCGVSLRTVQRRAKNLKEAADVSAA